VNLIDPTEYLTVEDLVDLTQRVTGAPASVRDYGLLSSAVARPATIAFGQVAYPELFDKAAALLHSIRMNHALVDGNTRLAWAATVTFLELNGQSWPPIDVDAAVAFMLSVADGTLTEISTISSGLRRLYGVAE
jgi:death-on-curing protein